MGFKIRGYPMFQKTNQLSFILTLSIGLICLSSGCGSEETVAPQKKVNKEVKNKAASVPKSRKKIAKAKKKKRKPVINANPEDLFAETDPVPNFQIIESTLIDENTFEVSLPPDEYGLASFKVLDQRKRGRSPSRSNQKIPEGFSALPEFGYAEDGMPLRIFCELDESEMAYIPSSVAVVGSKNGPAETTPELAIELDSFYIDVTEVTVEQFLRFLKESRKTASKVKEEQANLGSPSDHPILGVRWYEARKYSLWAGKKLPSEAEWERAARSSEGFNYVWGNGRPTWSQPRVPGQIDPVQSFPTDLTEEGVYDLAGNAMEWCQDNYRSDAFSKASTKAAGTVLKNWLGPKKAEEKGFYVIKGNGSHWESWSRTKGSRAERLPLVGFRSVLRLEKVKEEVKEEDSET
jgi:Sulfatase-modifying factor enzyme 1